MTQRLACLIAVNDHKRRELFRVQADYKRRKNELQYMHNLLQSAFYHDAAIAASRFPASRQRGKEGLT